MNTTLVSRQSLLRTVSATLEAIVLLAVCLAPWAFGCTDPHWELALYAVVAVLLILWGVHQVLGGKITTLSCPVLWCLAGLFLLGVFQVVSLPAGFIATLSPRHLTFYDRLLPKQPEELPVATTLDPVTPPVGTTLSFYPNATRRELLRLLAVFAVFLVVRTSVASPRALQRLALVAVLNGALLGMFAMLQYLTSPGNVVYWNYPTGGSVFGPYVCRNHFPYYLNVCAGLGLGLLLSLPALRASSGRQLDSSSRRRGRASTASETSGWGTQGFSWWDVFHDPRALWLGLALTVMLVSVLFSLSRGGFLALAGAGAVCLLVQPSGILHRGVFLIAAAVVLMLSWLGMERVENRIATLTETTQLQQGRLELWARCLQVGSDFPVTGTGYGTCQYVEPLYRADAKQDGVFFENAHNEYLDALIEGGLPRLVLSLALIGVVFSQHWRAVRRRTLGGRNGALALGALFGFTTLVIHSLMDFGLHMPANALLAAVLTAQLVALQRGHDASRLTPADDKEASSEGPATFRINPTALVTTGVALVVGCVLVHEGWWLVQAERFRHEVDRIGSIEDPDSRGLDLEPLREASHLASSDADLQVSLGELYQRQFQERLDALNAQETRCQVAQGLLAWGSSALPATGGHPALSVAPSWWAGSVVRAANSSEEKVQLAESTLLPALQHFVRARDLCPVLAAPNVQLAANAYLLDQADPPETYLARALFLRPADPDIWYASGLQDWTAGQREPALKSWRRSLELSSRHLESILDRVQASVPTEELCTTLLPADPTLLITAADYLYSQPANQGERGVILERALQLLDSQPEDRKAVDLYVQASIHRSLNQHAEAIDTYREALTQAPNQTAWRLQLAQTLQEQGRLEESRRELQLVLDQQPRNGRARALLKLVTRALAEGKPPR